MPKKIAIISTHPIQYYAPVFRLLAQQITIKVFYTWGEQSLHKYDKGFNKSIKWDIPLLEDYDYEFLKNTAKDKGTHHFNGIINSNAIERIKKFDPDSLLIYGWAWSSHLTIIRYFNGKLPLYFRGDSTLLNAGKGIKNLIKKIFLKWLYRHIDIAFYVGTANKAYFKAFGLKDNQLIFAPHSIDNLRFSQTTSTPNKFREELKLKEDAILILFAGKLDPVKNPFLLLDAFATLQLPNVHLLFVGNGSLEKDLKKKQAIENISNVHFIDFQNQSLMPEVYQACDLFCLPSVSETWGLAVNEAMASGKAILVSNKVGCAIDLVKKNCGSIFLSEDIADLQRKLVALTTDKARLVEMGKISKKLIQSWSFEEQVKVIVDYVNS